MKKLLLLFVLALSFASYAQNEENITQGLITFQNGIPEWTTKTLGCCAGDPANDPDQVEALCVPTIYTIDMSLVPEDFLIITKTLILRNCQLKVINGSVIFDEANGGELILYTYGEEGTDEYCTSSYLDTTSEDLVFNSVQSYLDAQEVLSVDKIQKQVNSGELPDNLEFKMYDVTGKLFHQGNTNNFTTQALKNGKSIGVYWLVFIDENKMKVVVDFPITT